jgi:hypothetical protein
MMAFPVGGGEGLTDATSNCGAGGADWAKAGHDAKTIRPATATSGASRWMCRVFIVIASLYAAIRATAIAAGGFFIIDDWGPETLLTI